MEIIPGVKKVCVVIIPTFCPLIPSPSPGARWYGKKRPIWLGELQNPCVVRRRLPILKLRTNKPVQTTLKPKYHPLKAGKEEEEEEETLLLLLLVDRCPWVSIATYFFFVSRPSPGLGLLACLLLLSFQCWVDHHGARASTRPASQEEKKTVALCARKKPPARKKKLDPVFIIPDERKKKAREFCEACSFLIIMASV